MALAPGADVVPVELIGSGSDDFRGVVKILGATSKPRPVELRDDDVFRRGHTGVATCDGKSTAPSESLAIVRVVRKNEQLLSEGVARDLDLVALGVRDSLERNLAFERERRPRSLQNSREPAFVELYEDTGIFR